MKTKLTKNDLIVRKYFDGYKLLTAKKKYLDKKLQKAIYSGMNSNLGSMDYSKPHVSGGSYNDAPTQLNAVIEIQTQIKEVIDRIADMDDTINMVNEVSNDDISSKILCYCFIDGMNMEQISLKFDKSNWTLYKKRKEAINNLAFIIADEIQLDEEDIKSEDAEEEI